MYITLFTFHKNIRKMHDLLIMNLNKDGSEIAGLNLAGGMDMCQRCVVLRS